MNILKINNILFRSILLYMTANFNYFFLVLLFASNSLFSNVWIQPEDEFKIKVGELFGYENVNWASHFPSDFGIRTPEVIEGEGTICVLSDDSFSVLAESPGSCSVKYPSNNGGSEGFIFLTITVVDS